jgi:imidazolonepropionase-like amidohydrolase
MLRKLTIVFLMLLGASAYAHGNLKLVNGRWYDGTEFVAKTMYAVDDVLRDSHDGEARELDLQGMSVIPPLADAHNHVFADGMNADEQLGRYLRAGIFYVKNPNNSAKLTAPIRARMNTPETVDVTYANGGLTRGGGHPAQIYAQLGSTFVDPYYTIDSAAELDAKWERIRAGKPDFIKIYLEHSEDPKKNRGLDAALVPLIVQRAHRDGLPVAAHVSSAADFHLAVASGVDELAHLPLAPIAPADAELAAKKNVTVVTTLLSHRPNEGFTDHRANLALLKRAGVNVVLGVDGGALVLDELEALTKLGVYTNAELLRMAVEATPRQIFPSRKIGRLTNGYEASFLVVHGNPLEDLSALRRVALRVKQGHVIEPPAEVVTEEQQRNRDGYMLLNHGQFAEAIAVFKENTEKFPSSSNVWDSLGEAYMKAGEKALAIASYRKSLELNPKNTNAEEMLKKLLSE